MRETIVFDFAHTAIRVPTAWFVALERALPILGFSVLTKPISDYIFKSLAGTLVA